MDNKGEMKERRMRNERKYKERRGGSGINGGDKETWITGEAGEENKG